MKNLLATNRKSTLWVLIAVSLLLVISVSVAFYNSRSRSEVGNIEVVPISLDHKTYGNVSELREDSHTILTGVVLDDGTTERGPSPRKSGDGTEIPGIARTEFSVRVGRLFKGDANEGQIIAVVLTGGTIDEHKYEAEGMPWLTKGEDTLMYLNKGEDGKYYPMAGGASLALRKSGSTDTFVLPEAVFNNGKSFEVGKQDL